ncbi:MAG: hypothetical protein QM493_06740 [Sulfurovum sp.]
MKKAYEIISHLSSQPQFRLLKCQECYQKYIRLLGNKWSKAVAFIYIKDDTLFVAVKHPAFKMELSYDYNKNLLRSLLRQLNQYDKSCDMMKASSVVVFHSKYFPIEKTKEAYKSVPHYSERANGDFTNYGEDSLKEKFENIQRVIKCNQS